MPLRSQEARSKRDALGATPPERHAEDTQARFQAEGGQVSRPGGGSTPSTFATSSSATSLPTMATRPFSSAPSERTKAVWAKLQPYFKEEIRKGVLDVDAKTPSSLTSHKPGYIDRDNEVIVGLQTDAPFRRAIMPYGGLRMVEAGLKAAGFEPDPIVHEIFTKYRKTHNEGVFDAYTPEIMACRRSHIITGLPDAYGRGRIIGDYRRVALYGTDKLLEAKRAERALLDAKWPTDDVIREREELAEQMRALADLATMAETLRLRHRAVRRRMRAKPCSGPISAISAPSRRRTARPCPSAASRPSSTSTSSAI